MKNYKLIISLLIVTLFVSGCGSSGGGSGELVGANRSRGEYFEPRPAGMSRIPRGSIRIGPSDEDPTAGINPTRNISVDAFFMDDTEVTNNEYRQFTSWVRDSIARSLLYENGREEFGLLDYDNNYVGLNWDEPIDWSDAETIETLEELFLPEEDRFFGRREIDAHKLFFDFAWIDFQEAAKRENAYDYKTGQYGDGSITRADFVKHDKTNVYPDTLCWIRDFTYSYNEPWTMKYYSHPAFDNYPVVGVTWKQANAFCRWRTQQQNSFLSSIGKPDVMDYRLPTEVEWEYAARGGLQNSMYPWGGYYSRNQQGDFMANFKPLRGNYVKDNGMYTMRVGQFAPNDYSLYDMAGNVAEWTIDTYDPLAYSQISDLNPTFKYDAQDDDPSAMKRKVVRGGSWKDISYYLQVSTRDYEYQDVASSFIGFRCVRSAFGESDN